MYRDEETYKGKNKNSYTWAEGAKVKTWANKHKMYFGLKFRSLASENKQQNLNKKLNTASKKVTG